MSINNVADSSVGSYPSIVLHCCMLLVPCQQTRVSEALIHSVSGMRKSRHTFFGWSWSLLIFLRERDKLLFNMVLQLPLLDVTFNRYEIGR